MLELKIASANIWLCNKAVDFRKSIDGLSELIYSQFNKVPTQDVYVFFNSNKDKIKLLGWHGNGLKLLFLI